MEARHRAPNRLEERVPREEKKKVGARHRASYTLAEERAVVEDLLAHGGYSQRGGTLLWRRMETSGVCPGRTWQSLKGRFDKHILFNLNKFGVSKTDLMEADRRQKDKGMEVAKVEGGDVARRAGYTPREDATILAFIAENRRQGHVGGVELWKLMEKRGVVEGRSWQSLKERFRKTILKKIKSYGLPAEQVKAFTATEGKQRARESKQKRMVARSSQD